MKTRTIRLAALFGSAAISLSCLAFCARAQAQTIDSPPPVMSHVLVVVAYHDGIPEAGQFMGFASSAEACQAAIRFVLADIPSKPVCAPLPSAS